MEASAKAGTESLYCYFPSSERNLRAEESLDVILPDRFPDASEILSVSGSAAVREYDSSSGTWSVLTTAELCALFLSENGEVRALSAEIPLTIRSTLSAAGDEIPFGEVMLTAKEARIVNSRKLSFSASLTSDLTVFRAEDAHADSLHEKDVIEKTAEKEVLIRTGVLNEVFSLQDDLALPASDEAFGTIVSKSLTLTVTEAKVIHEKIVVRASAHVAVVTLSGEGFPENSTYDLPFTRIFEVREADEETISRIALFPRKLLIEPVGEEGKRALSVYLEAEAQILCCRRTLYRYAEDAYSLSKELSLLREKMVFPLSLSEEECEEKFLDTVEFPLDPDAIHLFRTSLSPVSAFMNDAGRLILETDLEAEFLYTAEERQRCLKKCFRFSLERNAPELPARIQADVVSAHFTLPAMRRSEIEAVIKFAIFTEEDAVLDVVTGWESAEKELDGLPSYLLLRPEAGVTLFSLAKRTHSSPDLIAEANGISPDAAPPSGRLLLIPVIKGN